MSLCTSVGRPSVFSFSDDNLSKCQCIFTTFGMRIDIVESWQISSLVDRVFCQPNDSGGALSFHVFITS